MSLFLRNEDPHVHLSAANYILRRVQVQCGWLKSDWDHVWVGSGCQIPGTVLWWQACVFHLVSACACFMPYTFVFCLCRPYAGIFVLVFVLFRPCSSYLFLFSTYIMLVYSCSLSDLASHSPELLSAFYFVFLVLIFLVWFCCVLVPGTLAVNPHTYILEVI